MLKGSSSLKRYRTHHSKKYPDEGNEVSSQKNIMRILTMDS
jgi:hypothetical protein